MTPVTQTFLNFNYSTYYISQLLGRPVGRPEKWSSIPVMGEKFSFFCRDHASFGVHEVLYLVGNAVHCPSVMGPDSEADG